jgi:circadian clock protein KaiB
MKPANAKGKAAWRLQIFVAGGTGISKTAVRNLDEICKTHLGEGYSIEVVDITKKPEILRSQQILATPTVIRVAPEPEKRIVGDLTMKNLVLKGLGIPADGKGDSEGEAR